MAKAAKQLSDIRPKQSKALLAQYVEQQKAIDVTAAALANALLHEAKIPPGTIVRGDDRYGPVKLFEVDYCHVSCGHFPDVWTFGLNSDGTRQGARYSFPLHSLSPVERASS